MGTRTKTAKSNYEEICRLDQEERDRLLMENLPQVHYIARRIHDRLPQHVLLEDLINAGIVGLLEAIRNYDPGRNVKISTYAKIRIQGAILDSLRDLDWSPRELRKKGRQVEQSLQRLRGVLGRAPSEIELAEDLKMNLKDLQDLLAELRGLDLGSLQAIAAEDGQEDRLQYVPNSPDQDPLYLCERSELRQYLARAIDELPERERQVLALYYFEELTMKEVGAVLGLGEGRISQIHSAAVLRLRARMQEMLAARPSLATPTLEENRCHKN
jgi:RNA polymerase sigma factor for flagellar operon FliA